MQTNLCSLANANKRLGSLARRPTMTTDIEEAPSSKKEECGEQRVLEKKLAKLESDREHLLFGLSQIKKELLK